MTGNGKLIYTTDKKMVMTGGWFAIVLPTLVSIRIIYTLGFTFASMWKIKHDCRRFSLGFPLGFPHGNLFSGVYFFLGLSAHQGPVSHGFVD